MSDDEPVKVHVTRFDDTVVGIEENEIGMWTTYQPSIWEVLEFLVEEEP